MTVNMPNTVWVIQLWREHKLNISATLAIAASREFVGVHTGFAFTSMAVAMDFVKANKCDFEEFVVEYVELPVVDNTLHSRIV